MYCIIVGDIANSRSLTYDVRNKVALQAKSTFEQLNNEYSNCILAPFGLVRGDSFEGVLIKRYDNAPAIVQKIIKSFYQVERTVVRICIVLGELSVLGSNLNEADGPAFHKAADILDEMKETGNLHWLQVSFDISSGANQLVGSIMELLATLTMRWSDKQREIVWSTQEHGGYQKEVADLFGISYPVISRQLKVSHYETYCRAWRNLAEYLADIERKNTCDERLEGDMA